MRKAILSIFVTGALTIGTTNAHALIVNFDDLNTRNNFFALGIENTYLGYSWSPAGSTTGWAVATTSDRVSGESLVPPSGNTYGWNWNGPQSLFINFGEATDVTGGHFAKALGPPTRGDNASSVQLFGYDDANALINNSGIFGLTGSFQQFNFNLQDIHRLEIRANADGQWFAIDNLVVNEAAPTDGGGNDNTVIPEPASIALLGSGLFGLAGIRRRKKS